MALEKTKTLTLDDTIWTVVDVLIEHTDVPTARLREIAAEVSGMEDAEAQRSRILELAGVA